MGVISHLKKLNFANLLYQVADPPTFYTKSRRSEKSAEVREFLYQVADVPEVREVREVPGGYGPPTLVVFV